LSACADTHSKIIGYFLWISAFRGRTGLVYLLTGALLLFGVFYDFWTLNSQVSEQNRSLAGR
jgi:hypothetical protein